MKVREKFVKMREVISIHVGQAGVQWGNACWELYCLGTCSAHIFTNPKSTNPELSNCHWVFLQSVLAFSPV